MSSKSLKSKRNASKPFVLGFHRSIEEAEASDAGEIFVPEELTGVRTGALPPFMTAAVAVEADALTESSDPGGPRTGAGILAGRRGRIRFRGGVSHA